MDDASAQAAIAQEVRRVLSALGWDDASAGRALGVERRTIQRWKHDGAMPAYRLAQLAELAGLTVVVGGQDESPPPKWARGLTNEVLNEFRLLRDDLLERSAGRAAEIAARQELGLRPSDEGSVDSLRGLPDREVTRGEP